MSQPEPPPEPSTLAILREFVQRGHRFAADSDVPVGKVRMWSGTVRAQLRKLFGPESDTFALWPTADTPFPPGRARETLLERVAQLGRLIDGISTAASSALSPSGGHRVFIGHGRSPLWRELKDFIQERLGLSWDEFNREAVAGVATTERLTQMLNSASFAFLVMTAEDEHADSTIHARENVVHELGLFQGKLSMRRAIILLEQGCEVFSNVHGLSYIPFPRGHIAASFEEIRRVLERERLIGT